MRRRVPAGAAEEPLRLAEAGTAAVSPGPAPTPPPLEADGAVRTYEDLDGAEGRAVFFRPHRHCAADLAPLRSTVLLLSNGVARECALRDVSQNGVAFTFPRGLPLGARQQLEIAVRFDDHEAFRGGATVGSVREEDGTVVVGVSFNDFLLDVDEVLELRNVQAWRATGSSPRIQRSPWALAGHERYKSLVAELRLRFEDWRRQLDAVEERLPWHVLHGDPNPARAALVAQLRHDFVPEMLELSAAIDAAVREIPGAFGNSAAKEWSRRHVDEFLMQSPGCHRSRLKPFGYPGDYEVMNFMYGDHFVGATLFARAVELAFNQTPPSEAVRSRKDFVKTELKKLVLSRGEDGGRPVRVLSIAAGPARELVELFHELGKPPVPVEVVLFEQDKNALAHAWRRLQALGCTRGPGTVQVTFLHDSIKRLLRDETLFSPFGQFDVIYTCGLYDYLQHRTAVVLTRRLASLTAPGGRLLVANMIDHATRWLMEFHLDWPLVYRTYADLLDIGTQAVPRAALRIIEERSGTNPFLELIRS